MRHFILAPLEKGLSIKKQLKHCDELFITDSPALRLPFSQSKTCQKNKQLSGSHSAEKVFFVCRTALKLNQSIYTARDQVLFSGGLRS